MTHQSYLDPLAKTSVRNSPAPRKLPIFGFPPPLELSVARRGGGGGGGKGYFLELHTKNNSNNNNTHTHKKNAKTTKLNSR